VVRSFLFTWKGLHYTLIISGKRGVLPGFNIIMEGQRKEPMERRQARGIPRKRPELMVGYESIIPSPKARLLDQAREVMRLKHYLIHSGHSHGDGIRRYMLFHHMRARGIERGRAKGGAVPEEAIGNDLHVCAVAGRQRDEKPAALPLAPTHGEGAG